MAEKLYCKNLTVNQKPITERLLDLSVKTGYNCIQKNGQRFYGPPPNWHGPEPPKGSEVFIGRLPRDCFEDELVPVLEVVAPIYQLRLMMNFTGFNRGFAFVTYRNITDAWKAVVTLNNYELRPGQKIGVSISTDNCRLYIGSIPVEKTQYEAYEELSKYVASLKKIIMYPSPQDRTKNRGFFFAEFACHRSAAMAKRILSPGNAKLWNADVVVDWAEPEPELDPSLLKSITKLFVRNIASDITINSLRSVLETFLPSKAIQRIYIAGYFGFIHFDSRENAELAKEKLSQITFDGEKLEIHWARPKYFKKTNLQYKHAKHVPPKPQKLFLENYTSPVQEIDNNCNYQYQLLPYNAIQPMNHPVVPTINQNYNPQFTESFNFTPAIMHNSIVPYAYYQ